MLSRAVPGANPTVYLFSVFLTLGTLITDCKKFQKRRKYLFLIPTFYKIDRLWQKNAAFIPRSSPLFPLPAKKCVVTACSRFFGFQRSSLAFFPRMQARTLSQGLQVAWGLPGV